jgi:hypothetical protein
MKSCLKLIILSFLYITCLFPNIFRAEDKGKLLNIVGGYSMPEFLHLGVRYEFSQFQLGISVGKHDNLKSFSYDFFYHYTGDSELSYRHTWFLRFGLNFVTENDKMKTNKTTFLGVRVGHDINLTSNVGIALDIGVLFIVDEEEIDREWQSKDQWSGFDLEPDIPFLPCAGATFYIRIF